MPTNSQWSAVVAELEEELARLESEVRGYKQLAVPHAVHNRLREAAQYVKDDLKLRAVDGVVAIGSGAWLKLCKALEPVKESG